jgi:uncharacterized protein (DUF2236 family)
LIVSRADLEAALAELQASCLDPRAGIHGPGTHAWALGREAINFVGGPRAAFLQLAHPYVAYAIDQHSETRADVQGRFRRTFENVFAMTMGDLDHALAAARRVHAIHSRVNGTIGHDLGGFRAGHRYHANESSALLWVWATLVDTMVQVHELWVRELTERFKDQLVRDMHRFAALFAIPPAELPADWAAFRGYVDGMLASDLLVVSPPALEMSRFLLEAPRPVLAPLMAWMRVMTAGLLPERLRDGFQLRFGRPERALFTATGVALRPLYKLAPRPLRWVPPYQAARARVEGRPPPRSSRVVQRLALSGISAATHP